MTRGVFVLGMHRSGTSAATRLVNLMGVPTCAEEDLFPATQDNPRGYWESASLSAFNDRILAALESDWSCPPLLAPGWEANPVLAELRAEAVELFARVCPSEQWVWKDPRNSVTLPFWLDLLDAQPVVVLVHRNPLEIAASLEARDELGKIYSLALWERYARTCLAAISRLPALVTTYDEILAAPLAWCERAGVFLGNTGVGTRAVDAAEALGFVGTELRHAHFSPADVADDPAVTSAQRDLFAFLDELVGVHESLSLPSLPAETFTTEALLAERRRRHPQEREYRELGEYSRTLGEQFVELERRYVELRRQFVELERKYVELQKDAEGTWAEFGKLKRYSDDLGERFLELERYARELQARVARQL